MSWAEIKKSLNSDLRTPLDVLLRSILEPMETNVNKIGNTTYGLEAIKAKVDSVADKYYAPSSTVLQSLGVTTTACVSNKPTTGASDDHAQTVMKVSDNFIPKADGMVNISGKATFTITKDTTSTSNYQWAYVTVGIVSIGDTNFEGLSSDSYASANALITSTKSKGTKLLNNKDDSDNELLSTYVKFAKTGYYYSDTFDANADGTTCTISFDTVIPVKKGMPVYVLLRTDLEGSNSYASVISGVVTNLQIKGALNTL